jgi:hypothetical protein
MYYMLSIINLKLHRALVTRVDVASLTLATLRLSTHRAVGAALVLSGMMTARASLALVAITPCMPRSNGFIGP